MNFFRERELSQAASDLVQFDAESIRQVVSSRHRSDPDVWLVDPDAYEQNGRVLRDTESARMLAYSTKDQILYCTDGCNSCARQVRLESLAADELKTFAADNELRPELVQHLATLSRTSM
jgi:hypothetical protein